MNFGYIPAYDKIQWRAFDSRKTNYHMSGTLRKKCPYSELFWSAFSRIRTEYGESVRIRENTDQNNSKYGPVLMKLFTEAQFNYCIMNMDVPWDEM